MLARENHHWVLGCLCSNSQYKFYVFLIESTLFSNIRNTEFITHMFYAHIKNISKLCKLQATGSKFWYVIIQVITCRLARFRFIWMNGLEILTFEVRYFPFNFMGKSVDNFQLELFSRAAIIKQMRQVELFTFVAN